MSRRTASRPGGRSLASRVVAAPRQAGARHYLRARGRREQLGGEHRSRQPRMPSEESDRLTWFDRFAGAASKVASRAWYFASRVALAMSRGSRRAGPVVSKWSDEG